MKNALSVDVEEYFHAEAFAATLRPGEWPSLESRVAATTERLLDTLAAAEARATFFVLGWVAERQPALVRRVHAEGHEVGCHGYGHRMLHRMTRGEFAQDTARAKAILEDVTGTPVVGYRAPTFSITRETWWGLEVLAELGFRYDSSVFPILHDRYGVPDAPRFPHRVRLGDGAEITEFPPSTVTVLGRRLPVAGGGYFRLYPYALTRAAIRSLNTRAGQPAMVYLHPWEIDPEQPPLPSGRLARLRHRLNLRRTEPRLRRLLRDFAFLPAAEILALTGLLAMGESR